MKKEYQAIIKSIELYLILITSYQNSLNTFTGCPDFTDSHAAEQTAIDLAPSTASGFGTMSLSRHS
jgi:hypothetical protein